MVLVPAWAHHGAHDVPAHCLAAECGYVTCTRKHDASMLHMCVVPERYLLLARCEAHLLPASAAAETLTARREAPARGASLEIGNQERSNVRRIPRASAGTASGKVARCLGMPVFAHGSTHLRRI